VTSISRDSTKEEVRNWLVVKEFPTEPFSNWDGEALFGAELNSLMLLLHDNPTVIRLHSTLNSLRTTALSQGNSLIPDIYSHSL